MARRIPAANGKWLLGNLTEVRAGMLPFLERCRREYGTVVSFRLGLRRLILVSDPELIEEVLVTQNKSFKKHFATRLLKPVLGNGLLLSEGQQWLRQRRLIQPAFSRRFTQDFAEIVELHASRLADQWRQTSRRDLYHDVTQLTVSIAAHAFLGISEAKESEEIGECLQLIHGDFEHRFQRVWNVPLWIPTDRNRQLQNAISRLTAIIDCMIDDQRDDLDERNDALSLMLRVKDEDGQRMPRQLLRDEVMTLLLAGHDTTANGLTWTFFLLAQHKEVMADLQQQLRDASTDVQPTDIPLVEQVVKESMRLFPPVFLFGREAIRGLDLGGYSIKKGDSVVLSQWIVHRDEQFYPKSAEFQPARWTSEFQRTLPKYAYFPFGGGPRACIGREVAMQEAKGALATLAGEFAVELESPQDVVPWPTVTLRPRSVVWAKVTPQGQPASSVSDD